MVLGATRQRNQSPGAPSFAFLAKGGIRDCRFEDSCYPTLRKKREGWGTRRFVAVSKTSMRAPFHAPAGRRSRWSTDKKQKACYRAKPQVPPLRFAPVGMTNSFEIENLT